MNIIISNRFNTLLKSLDIEVIKELNGEYEVDDIIKQFANLYYDRMIIDISAIKNNMDITTIQKLSASLDMSKVILLLDENKYFSTQEFISSIISVGIYNFTKNIEGVKYLLKSPNSYGDVMKYHKVDVVKEEVKEEKQTKYIPPKKYTDINDIYASTVLTPAEKDELITKLRMQETIKQAKIGGEKSTYVRKKNFAFRIVLTAIILPLMAFSLTYLYYFLLYNSSNWIKIDSKVGKVLFKEIWSGGITYVTLIAIILIILLMKVFFSIIKTKIKSNKSSCLKFSLIPFGIFTTIICFDKYIVTFLDNILKLKDVTIKAYMNNSLYFDFKVICSLMVFVYFFGLLTEKLKVIEFEQEISQKTSILEKIYTFILLVTIILPGLHYIFNLYTDINGITDFFNEIFKVNNLMIYITIVETLMLISLITIEVLNYTKLKQKDTK